MNKKRTVVLAVAIVSICFVITGVIKVYNHFSWEKGYLQNLSSSLLELQEENDQKNQRLEELKEQITVLQAKLNPPVRIVCWGDSLTVGAGGEGTSYPSVIRQLALDQGIQVDVVNMGVGGENSKTILARGGGIRYCIRRMFYSGRTRACGSSISIAGWQLDWAA